MINTITPIAINTMYYLYTILQINDNSRYLLTILLQEKLYFLEVCK